MTSRLRQSLSLFASLSLIAGLVACGSSSSSNNGNPGGNSTPPAIAISVSSGNNQSAAVGSAFAKSFAALVTSNGSPASGVSVTFTAPSQEPDGSFSKGATDTETTGSNGIATTSQAFTAGTAAGAYTVTASTSGASQSAKFSLTNTAGSPATVTVVTGYDASAAINGSFGPLSVTVVDSDNNPVSGASVTFTAPASGASGTFANTGTNAETDSTSSNGVATTSVFSANSIPGVFAVNAAVSGVSTAAAFNLTSATLALGAGNYVFSLNGTDANGVFYTMAGVISVNSSGAITAGEQDFSDYEYFVSAEAITGGSIAPSSTTGDGNFAVTLQFADPYINNGACTVTFDASVVSASEARLTEFDSWATSSGRMDLQAQSISSPTGGWAFTLGGADYYDYPIAVGGVVNVDGAGTISGTGSIFDINDGGTLTTSQLFTASTVSATPDQYGLVTFALNSSSIPVNNTGSPTAGIILDGYIVDSGHIRLVENWMSDDLDATTGGTALAQTGTGTFSSSSVSGAYVVGSTGYDDYGPLQTLGALTFNSDGSVTGNFSLNDMTYLSPQGGTTLAAESTLCSSGSATTACYTIDGPGVGNDGGTGRVTISNVTDQATFGYNLELYLTGNGEALVISLDNGSAVSSTGADVLSGIGAQQASGTFTAASFNGNYTFNATQAVPNSGTYYEQDAIGAVNANGGNLAGFVDVNEAGTTATPIPTPFLPVAGNFAVTTTNSVLTGTTADPVVNGQQDTFTYYLVDGNTAAGIENDTFQLTLGTFELQ
jgi:hypothetical protein